MWKKLFSDITPHNKTRFRFNLDQKNIKISVKRCYFDNKNANDSIQTLYVFNKHLLLC
jgi:hypothetical protein